MKHKYLGALHIHSTYSDGSKDVDYIIKQAAKARLKWIIITDHNTLEPLRYEGFHNGVCVIVGTEITPPTSNHLLAFNTKEVISENIGERNYIDEVHKQGGFCFAAHPDESMHRENVQKPLRWNDWSIDTFDGLEIWNYLTDWTDNYTVKKNLMLQYFSRHKITKGPSKNLLAWWDRLNNKKDDIVPAVGGLDAHSFPFGKHGFLAKISDYYDFFKALNNAVYLDMPLSKNYFEARAQILNAIKIGNNILINKKVSTNTNIEYFVENKGEKFYAGEIAKLGDYSKLILKLPQKALCRIIHNGILIYENETKILEYDRLNQGKYRIEVYKNNTPWIFTNPIKVI